MSGAVFGLIGVIIGSLLNWFREMLTDLRTRSRHARYLAIRVVCVLDKYVENCAEVVNDDGLDHGQRDEQGYLQVQVETPDVPAFPSDLDWKSIDHSLMYRIFSMPNEAEAADSKISFVWDYIARPPDFEEYFEERQDQYARLGLAASAITQELRRKYGIPSRDFGDWNPIERLTKAKQQVEEDRLKRAERSAASPLLTGK
jgi:hypothetical protein